jgi:hypothetical protein
LASKEKIMVRSILLMATAAALAACSQAEAPPSAAQTSASSTTSTPTSAMASYTAAATEEFAGGPPVSPDEVRSMIEAEGAQRTIAALSTGGDKTRWTSVMAGIATGEAAWLALATPLEPGAENESYGDLNYALKAAMVANPSGVLAIVNEENPDLSTESICAPAGYEADAAWSAAYYDALTPAVESVTDPSLASVRSACLEILRARLPT